MKINCNGKCLLNLWRITKDILKVENIFNIELPMDLQILAFLLVHPRHFHIMGIILHFLFIKKYHHTEWQSILMEYYRDSFQHKKGNIKEQVNKYMKNKIVCYNIGNISNSEFQCNRE